jgi:hypothetical protein
MKLMRKKNIEILYKGFVLLGILSREYGDSVCAVGSFE